MSRLDLKTVLGWVPTGSRVLDLGCGDGTFLARLRDERRAIGVGVDIDPDKLVAAVGKGLDVIQEDINNGLHCFTANRFDVVVLAHALQELTHPHIALQRMVDIADEAIVSFPNFGHWACRLHLGIKGKMPMSRAMPLHWYDTPNIHFCTVRDFEALCSALDIDIIERATIAGSAQHLLGNGTPICVPSAPSTAFVARAVNRRVAPRPHRDHHCACAAVDTLRSIRAPSQHRLHHLPLARGGRGIWHCPRH